MNQDELKALLERVAQGEIAPDAAWESLRAAPPTAPMGFATVDHHRTWRCGHPEIVYGPGKHPEQVARIAAELVQRDGRLFVSRADAEQAAAVRAELPDAVYDETAQAIVRLPEGETGVEGVCIVAAGTADQRAAREAELCSRFLGQEPVRINDVGVAGIHRLFEHGDALRAAKVIIVVAGMEGALASVVGGLVAVPVIAVPTPVGYGAGAGGIAPLLGMLNSCAANVTVVNIDNGVGAAVVASLINAGCFTSLGALRRLARSRH